MRNVLKLMISNAVNMLFIINKKEYAIIFIFIYFFYIFYSSEEITIYAH